jgi:hypothetical protein
VNWSGSLPIDPSAVLFIWPGTPGLAVPASSLGKRTLGLPVVPTESYPSALNPARPPNPLASGLLSKPPEDRSHLWKGKNLHPVSRKGRKFEEMMCPVKSTRPGTLVVFMVKIRYQLSWGGRRASPGDVVRRPRMSMGSLCCQKTHRGAEANGLLRQEAAPQSVFHPSPLSGTGQMRFGIPGV